MPYRSFVPISIEDYVKKHCAANRDTDRRDMVKRLKSMLARARAGERCSCDKSIWVVGSALAGLSCFTCITGEAYPSGDYEIAEAICLEDG